MYTSGNNGRFKLLTQCSVLIFVKRKVLFLNKTNLPKFGKVLFGSEKTSSTSKNFFLINVISSIQGLWEAKKNQIGAVLGTFLTTSTVHK